MFCLSAMKAKTFLNANLSFLWSELPDMYGIYIHSVWVLGSPHRGREEVRACGRRGGLVVFGSLGHNLTGSVPLGLEPFGFGVPFINGGGYRVHRVDAAHECQVESFSKEGDEDSLVNYPTEVNSNFEFIDVGEDLILGLCNGLLTGEGFHFEVSGEESFGEGVLEVGKDSELLIINGI